MKFPILEPLFLFNGVRCQCREDIAPLIISSAVGGGEWLTSRPSHFTSGKQPQYPLNRKLRVPQSRPGHLGKDKNLIPLRGMEPPSVQPAA